MPAVFVAGSRQVSRLPAEVRSRFDTMIEKGFQIQRYLADKSYPNVLVHCMIDHCRNNVGNWPTREVADPRDAKGFDY
jgi:adenine-specific DNA-methyltransferase